MARVHLAHLLVSFGVSPVLAAMTACNPLTDNDRGEKAPEAEPVQLVHMTEAEIRKSALGCLTAPPYPLDGGPTCLLPDGSWFALSGWGNAKGRYRIIRNKIVFETLPTSGRTKLAFYRTREGKMFMRQKGLRTRPFTPYPVADLFQRKAR
jgi:hypothetical protein